MVDSALKVVEDNYLIVKHPGADFPKEYKALVFSRWLRSLRYGNPIFKKMESDPYYGAYHAYIEHLLQKPESIVRLALLPANEDGPETVIGFSVSRAGVLDYIHVHKDQRLQGIAKKLLPNHLHTFTHYTNMAGLIWQSNSNYKHLKFNPHL